MIYDNINLSSKVLGVLFKRINAQCASVAVTGGFILGILMKVYVEKIP